MNAYTSMGSSPSFWILAAEPSFSIFQDFEGGVAAHTEEFVMSQALTRLPVRLHQRGPRATLVLQKAANHAVDRVLLRKV